jgi:hypothetical protein
MRRAHLALVLSGAAFVALIASAASCSLTTSFDGISGGTKPGVDTGVTTDSTAPTDTGGDSGGGSAFPPVRPDGPLAAGGGKTVYFGVKHFHYNHSNDALKTPNAWYDWGYDIDHVCTGDRDGTQNGTCIRSSAVTADVVKDGNLCRDNQLGAQIVPQLNIYNNHFENDTNAGLLDGAPTIMFQLDDLADGADDAYVPGRLYLLGRTKGSKPAWDGTDVRTIVDSSVTGGDLEQPITTFPRGYLKNHVWVSGDPSGFSMSIPMGEQGELLPMNVTAGTIAFKLSDAHTAVVDGTGVLAGAIRASDVESFLRPFMLTQTLFCPGTSQYDAFMKTIPTYVDVVIDAPTLQDPKVACDGLSFGLGINLSPIARPTTLSAATPPATGTCGGDAGDAGTDADETGTTDASDASSD